MRDKLKICTLPGSQAVSLSMHKLFLRGRWGVVGLSWSFGPRFLSNSSHFQPWGKQTGLVWQVCPSLLVWCAVLFGKIGLKCSDLWPGFQAWMCIFLLWLYWHESFQEIWLAFCKVISECYWRVQTSRVSCFTKSSDFFPYWLTASWKSLFFNQKWAISFLICSSWDVSSPDWPVDITGIWKGNIRVPSMKTVLHWLSVSHTTSHTTIRAWSWAEIFWSLLKSWQALDSNDPKAWTLEIRPLFRLLKWNWIRMTSRHDNVSADLYFVYWSDIKFEWPHSTITWEQTSFLSTEVKCSKARSPMQV